MMRNANWFVACLICLVLVYPCAAGVRGEKAQYLGGTASIPKDARGVFEFGPELAAYIYNGGRFELPYKAITSIEYGDKVGHRVGAAVALGATVIGLLALPVAFAKKKKHYVTIGYTQPNGEPGGLVFECPKSNYWITLEEFRVKTGIRPEEIEHGKALAATQVPPAPVVTSAAKPKPQEPAPVAEPVPPKPQPEPAKPAVAPARPEPPRPPDTRVLRLPG